MSQALLGSCPLHHKAFDTIRLHRRSHIWQGNALPTQKTAVPKNSRAVTWTVHAQKSPRNLDECASRFQISLIYSFAFLEAINSNQNLPSRFRTFYWVDVMITDMASRPGIIFPDCHQASR